MRSSVKEGLLPIPSLSHARYKIFDDHKAQIGENPPRYVTYASGDYLFVSAIFGRDGAQMGLDSIEKSQNLFRKLRKIHWRQSSYDRQTLLESAEHFHAVAHDTLLTMAQLQGTRLDRITGEEPGKIIHEYRSTDLLDKALLEGKITPEQKIKQMEIIARMSSLYGGKEIKKMDAQGKEHTDTQVGVYFSNDSTPLFLKLAHTYIDTLSPTQRNDFLHETYVNKDGTKLTMENALHQATDWIVETLEKGPLLAPASHPETLPRLLSWQHTNRFHQQILEDSQESWYNHETNSLTNEFAPRMATEVQGLVYDALKKSSKLFQNPNLMKLAREVQQDTVTKLWMPEERFFAQGLHYDKTTGTYKQVKTLCVTSSDLLDSDILRDLPKKQYRKYVKGIVEMLYSPQFLTPFGPRTQAVKHKDFFTIDGKQFSPYHGPDTTWLVLTGRVIKGFERVGLFGLAHDMRSRLLNATSIAGNFVEFLHFNTEGVLGNGHIDSNHPQESDLPWGKEVTINGKAAFINSTNHHENLQGWSYMAVEREIDKVNKKRFFATIPFSWQYRLENEVQGKHTNRRLRRLIPAKSLTTLLINADQVEKARQEMPVARVHVDEGKRLQKVLFEKLGVNDTFHLTREGVSTD